MVLVFPKLHRVLLKVSVRIWLQMRTTAFTDFERDSIGINEQNRYGVWEVFEKLVHAQQ